MSSGTPTFRDLRITDHVQSTGTATFIPAIGAAPTSLDYELLPYSATAIHQALAESALQLYDEGALVREFWVRGLVTGSPIYNAGWDDWLDANPIDANTAAASSTTHGPSGWTGANATVGRVINNANIGLGEVALSLLNTDNSTAGTVTLADPWRRYLFDMRGSSLIFRCWVKTGTASHARIGVTVTNSAGTATTTSSSYHSGSGGWELLSTATITTVTTDVEITVRVEVAETAGTPTAYFAECWLEGSGARTAEYPFSLALMPDGPDGVYRMGSAVSASTPLRHLSDRSALKEWDWLRHHNIQASSEAGILLLPRRATLTAQRLWIVGGGPLTVSTTVGTTADAYNIEVNESESLLLAKLAAQKLIEKSLPTLSALGTGYTDLLGRLIQDVARLKRGTGRESDVAQLGIKW